MEKFYHIVTYGCQMNVHESEKIAGILKNLGYIVTDEIYRADVIMFNTCCIRENAEFRAYGNIGALKKHKRRNPNVIIGVCGCMTQQDGAAEKLRGTFPFIDIILGTHNLFELHNFIQQKSGKFFSSTEDINSEMMEDMPIYRTSGVNAWVNIIYGCNNFCTYCIVPYVRGREKSRDFDTIVSEVESLLREGYKEITLLGQNVNSYGNDLGKEEEFARLLTTLANLPYKYRLKFMTSHPKDLSDAVIDTIAKYDNIAKYIHLPVQAGGDCTLKAMNRKYDSTHYISLIEKIKNRIKGVGITTDIMVGFPGESDADFNSTLELVKKCEFSGAFTFIYSRRSGTVADKMENQVDDETKSARIGELIALQNEISNRLANEYVGHTYEVLIEGKGDKEGMLCGRTDCGRLVSVPYVQDMTGRFVNVKITKAGIATLTGEIV